MGGAIRWAKRSCHKGAELVAFAGSLLAGPAAAEDAAVHALLFGSLDAGPSVFASTGIKAGPDRIDREGFAVLAVVGAGARMERSPASLAVKLPTLVRTTGVAALLGGYQFFFDWGVLGLFAGPEGSLEALMGSAGVGTVETRFGARLQGELWARPSADTLATATVVLGSARWDAFGRVSAGYRAFGAYFGPEAAAYADRTGYGKWSLGLHATDFAFGAMSFRLSGGCSYENELKRFGPYVALAAWMPL